MVTISTVAELSTSRSRAMVGSATVAIAPSITTRAVPKLIAADRDEAARLGQAVGGGA